ncbi:integrase catalytic domain-containing protein [Trichonephila clavipes]|uniref:Integrase catalytic domain-containing protein n=1 Tax=Trichonephila clavipes TaxID=2585209 RepID=A0A8X6SRZ7_TRICX|nr:integrase catalytic domain-containing protein [Trichonephila clavipes]
MYEGKQMSVEALVTDQISATNIPTPELDNIPQAVQLENLVLADSPDCQEPITILIGADYYYNVVTGKIKHLSKKLVAVETIFGWCLQGRNSENQSSLALSVVVQENLISDQLKKFWDLEVSGLIDSKNESDVSENQLMKNFESNIQYDVKAKWYKGKALDAENENRLIRLGGRLEFCNLSINEKHPLILPKNSWLTTLIVPR